MKFKELPEKYQDKLISVFGVGLLIGTVGGLLVGGILVFMFL